MGIGTIALIIIGVIVLFGVFNDCMSMQSSRHEGAGIAFGLFVFVLLLCAVVGFVALTHTPHN